MFLQIIILVVLFALSFFYSGMETGIVSLDMLRLEKDAKQEEDKKEMYKFLSHPDKFFGTTLIGNNIVNVLLAAYSTVLFHESFPKYENYVSLIAGVGVFVVGEILPKMLFREYSAIIVPKAFALLKISYYLFRPFVACVTLLNNWLHKMFNIGMSNSLSYLTKDDIALILANTKEDTTINHPQKEMLEDMLKFNSTAAEDIMVPRIDIIAFDEKTPVNELIEKVREVGFTRYPVYKDTIDNITGIIIIYDLIKQNVKPTAIARDFMRKACYSPENTSLNFLMKEMQKQKRSMSIIVDSFGGTAGIVTFEDILEEIVGDIEDEYDDRDDNTEIVRISEDTYIVDADVEVSDLNDDYNFELPDGNYKTIAGMVIDKLERIPKIGQYINFPGYRIQVIQANARKIERVKIKILSSN